MDAERTTTGIQPGLFYAKVNYHESKNCNGITPYIYSRFFSCSSSFIRSIFSKMRLSSARQTVPKMKIFFYVNFVTQLLQANFIQ